MTALLLSLLLASDCSKDSDCLVTSWRCCACPEQHAVSKSELRRQEASCAVKKCVALDCAPAKEVPDAYAVCKAGSCTLTTPARVEQEAPDPAPAGSECKTALDCQVWCCPADLASFPKGKPPAKGCKRCPAPVPASECLEGRCAVAPRALGK